MEKKSWKIGKIPLLWSWWRCLLLLFCFRFGFGILLLWSTMEWKNIVLRPTQNILEILYILFLYNTWQIFWWVFWFRLWTPSILPCFHFHVDFAKNTFTFQQQWIELIELLFSFEITSNQMTLWNQYSMNNPLKFSSWLNFFVNRSF